MTKKITKQEICYEHNRPLAPRGMAILVKRGYGESDKQLKALNLVELSDSERKGMSVGDMAFRHIIYPTYCQNTPITYE